MPENYYVKYDNTVGKVIATTWDDDGWPAFLIVRADGSHMVVRSVLTVRVPEPQSTTFMEMYY